jgi:uncharacterized membrane protein
MMNGWGATGPDWAWMSMLTSFVGTFFLVTIALIGQRASKLTPQRCQEAPRQVLAMRLARGEINEAEYQRLRSALSV